MRLLCIHCSTDRIFFRKVYARRACLLELLNSSLRAW